MRILSTFMLVIAYFSVLSQNPIKNSSFDIWYNTAFNVLVPADWMYDEETFENGGFERHQAGNALRLNIHSRSGQKFNTEVYQRDSLKRIPSAINFDYNVFNYNHSVVNRLIISAAFYKDSNLLKEYKWSSHFKPNTNDLLKNITVSFDKSAIKLANIFLVKINFDNYGGHEDEYAVVDNINFIIDSSSVSSIMLYRFDQSITIHPNPTTGIFNYSLEGNEKPSSIVVTSIDGKQTVFEPNFTNSINISTLVSGIYTVSFLDEKNAVIGRNKIVLTK